jgi:hypothetical protein
MALLPAMVFTPISSPDQAVETELRRRLKSLGYIN